MQFYKSNFQKLSIELKAINKHYNTVSTFRLIMIILLLFSLYSYFKNRESIYGYIGFLSFLGFVFLMQFHAKLIFTKKIKEALLAINTDEINFLENKKLPFENGIEFNDFHHPYAYDLDIFGDHSLFQNLNRAATFIGKKTLANKLMQLSNTKEIIQNQQAVVELSSKITWRQEFSAYAKIGKDTEKGYEELLQWSKFNSESLPKWAVFVSFIVPLLFFISIVGYIISSNTLFLNCASYLFVFNLIILGKFIKRIKLEIAVSEGIDKTINQYSLLLEKIEKETFSSKKLIELQHKLNFKSQNSSVYLKKLSVLFSKNDTIANVVIAIVFNGSFLFNLHVFKNLVKWKNENGHVLEEWLDIIGEFEFLNSLANFAYNNPDFAYPSLNSKFQIDFSNMSHPLLESKTRIGNEVSFYPQSFMILTGSNMSGKSTFLRSLGLNMVLTGMGSVVCAAKANVHPLPVLVSMRLSDSLSDSESYFFAEIKRLKQIMDALEKQPAFVLLDEILRGTNSDDKRNGTIEVIKKVIAKKAIGVIATHDIEVCLTAGEYPEILSNNCFEVEIINNDLHFDYKLRTGVCKNKSATFLMKKLGVI